ncbi:MAG: GlsB/YeaQ/YmgE family stress response membrane protein [Moraxella sp.]|nr:GlsB/YeaQ/YmgE family stress response membrane protein [Moraxella sp.]
MFSFIGAVIIGFVVGALARLLKPGKQKMGWIMTIVLGMSGSFVGAFIASALKLDVKGGFSGLVLSVIGAILVLFVYEFITGKRRIGQ